MPIHTRTLKLVAVPPLTAAQSAAMMRRVGAVSARPGSGHDPAIPATVPPGARVVHGPARRGRPRLTPEGTQAVTLRLPKRVLQYFKRGGRGWQTRAVATLTQAMEREHHSVRRPRRPQMV